MKTHHLKALFLLCLLLLLSTAAHAQRTITGTVHDQRGEPVPFATVAVTGSTTGATTDFDGRFSLVVSADATSIQVSFVGFRRQTVELGGQVTFNIILESEVAQLDEIVIIGYGTQTRRNLTGSVVSVSAEALRDNPVTQVADALAGRLAGVQVTTTEGSPDAEIMIRVRGGGSITQSSSTLFIVDGFPVSSISDIAPSEIASIDVLKDASSTAIYGARGANGVIIITTRSGSEGRITASYNFYATINNMAKRLPTLNPYQFALWQYELSMIQNLYENNYVNYFGLIEDIDLYKNVQGNDWQDIIFGASGYMFNHSFNVSGGNNYARFNATYNRINNSAIMMGSDFQRDNFNFRTTWNAMKGLSVDFTTRYSLTNQRGASANDLTGTTADARMRHVMVFTPIPIRNITLDEGDEEAQIGGFFAPPTTSIADNDRRRRQERLSMQGAVSYELIEGLRLRTEFGIDHSSGMDERFWGMSTSFVSGTSPSARPPGFPVAQWSNSERRTLRNTNTVNWNLDKRMPGNHHLEVLLGQEIIMATSRTATMRGDGFPTVFSAEQAWNFMSFRPNIGHTLDPTGADVAGATTVGHVYGMGDNLASFFGRANWRLGGTYLASVTMRADGSSRFAPGNQWGYFPSASVGWRLSDESFMKGFTSWLDNLMIRASLGMAGNNDIPTGQTSTMMRSPQNTQLFPTILIPASNIMSNPDLVWETMLTRNVGFSFNVLNYRFGGTIDFYMNNTRDLLILFPISGTGYTHQYRNIGETQNRGVDISLDANVVRNKNVQLDLNFNIGFNRNRVVSLGGLDEISAGTVWFNAGQTDDFKVFVGQALGQMWGYVYDGRYSAHDFYERTGTSWNPRNGVVTSGVGGHVLMPGAIRLKDLNGDGVVNADDMTVIGNATPKFTGGFGFSGRAWNFDFSTHFSFVYGNDVYNANKIDWTTNVNGQRHRNMLATMDHNGRYTFLDANYNFITDPDQLEAMNAHHNNFVPHTTLPFFSSYAVEDGSFLRCNNMTVGYTLPKNLTRKAGIQSLRFYATISNAFILTNYTGFDPEVSTRRATPLTPGVDFSAFPRSRGYTFGVNVTF